MTDTTLLSPWTDLFSAAREIHVGFSTSSVEARDTIIKLFSEGVVSVRGRVSVSGASDGGWMSNGREFQPWTPEAAALVRPIHASATEWGAAKIDWVDSVVRFQASTVLAVEVNTAELKSWLRAVRPDVPLARSKKEGRPPKIGWNQFYFEMICKADHPDGLPDEKTLKKEMVEWTALTFEDPPDRKTVEDRVKEYFDYKAQRRGNTFPAPR